MAKNFEQALEGLKAVHQERLRQAEEAFSQHSSWLREKVQEAKKNIAAILPAQPSRTAQPPSEDQENVAPLPPLPPKRRGRPPRAPTAKALAAIQEEGELAAAETAAPSTRRTRRHQPIAPEPGPEVCSGQGDESKHAPVGPATCNTDSNPTEQARVAADEPAAATLTAEAVPVPEPAAEPQPEAAAPVRATRATRATKAKAANKKQQSSSAAAQPLETAATEAVAAAGAFQPEAADPEAAPEAVFGSPPKAKGRTTRGRARKAAALAEPTPEAAAPATSRPTRAARKADAPQSPPAAQQLPVATPATRTRSQKLQLATPSAEPAVANTPAAVQPVPQSVRQTRSAMRTAAANTTDHPVDGLSPRPEAPAPQSMTKPATAQRKLRKPCTPAQRCTPPDLAGSAADKQQSAAHEAQPPSPLQRSPPDAAAAVPSDSSLDQLSNEQLDIQAPSPTASLQEPQLREADAGPSRDAEQMPAGQPDPSPNKQRQQQQNASALTSYEIQVELSEIESPGLPSAASGRKSSQTSPCASDPIPAAEAVDATQQPTLQIGAAPEEVVIPNSAPQPHPEEPVADLISATPSAAGQHPGNSPPEHAASGADTPAGPVSEADEPFAVTLASPAAADAEVDIGDFSSTSAHASSNAGEEISQQAPARPSPAAQPATTFAEEPVATAQADPAAAEHESDSEGVEEDQHEEDADEDEGDTESKPSASLAANLVSTIRSFLPMGGKVEPLPPGGKKAVKVKALAAADAARQKDAARAAERAKQREQLERQKAERIKQKEMQKIKAEEERKQQQRELEEARKRKEEEATQRRRALEAAEKREREEKARRLEELRAKRRLEDQRRKEAEAKQHADEERKRKAAKLVEQQEVEHKRARVQEKQQSAAAQPAVAVQNLVHSTVAAAASSAAGSAPTASVLAAVSALEAKARLQPAGSSFNAAMESRADSGKGPSTSSGPPPFPTAAAMSKALGARPLPGLAAAASKPLVAAAATPTTQLVPPGTQSYEISPYKSDEGSESEEEDEEPSKPVPEWARGRQLLAQLVSQLAVDPDEIFQQHAKTCSLDEVFGSLERERPGKKDLSRRTSSSNWIEDRVTWKEEMNYKKAMGYL